MTDSYQAGHEVEWVKHANDELTQLVKKQKRQVASWRLLTMVLVLVSGWVVFRYSQVRPVSDLWKVDVKALFNGR